MAPRSDPSAGAPTQRPPAWAVVVLVAIGYVLLAEVGFWSALPPGFASAVWPAAGWAMAAVMLWGPWAAVGVALGSPLVQLTLDTGVPLTPGRLVAVSVIGSGAALQALAAAVATRRLGRGPPELAEPLDTARFLVIVGPLSSLISSSVGVAFLRGVGVFGEDWWQQWLVWWAGDTLGVFLVSPVVFALLARGRPTWATRRPVLGPPSLLLLVLVSFGIRQINDLDNAHRTEEAEHRVERERERVRDALVLATSTTHALARVLSEAGTIDEGTLARFIEGVPEARHGVLTYSWNPLVAAEGRADFAQEILERGPDGLRPAGLRDRYCPVRWIVPREGNEAALGFDILSEPLRREAVERALRTGAAALSAPLRLVQDTGDTMGALLVVPVHRGGQPAGVAVAVLRPQLILDGLDGRGLDLRLRADGPEREVLAVRLQEDEPPGTAWALPSEGEPDGGLLRVADRTWRLDARTTKHFDAEHGVPTAVVAQTGAAVGVGLLCVLLLLASGRAVEERRRALELTRVNTALEAEVAERRRAVRALFEEKEAAEVTLHSIADGVVRVDPERRIGFMNPVAEELTGWTAAEAEGLLVDEVLRVQREDRPGEGLAAIGELLDECGEGAQRYDCILLGRGGSEYGVRLSPAELRDGEGRRSGWVIALSDVTETRRMAREAEHLARHDPLTGLVNRREFERRAALALEDARDRGAAHALAFLDLDQFKIVNDTAGHVAGDELLRQVAALLARQVRDGDVLARIGGDEFGLLLLDCRLARAYDIAERLVDSVRGFRFHWADRPFSIGVSVGLVAVEPEAGDTTELLSKADVACYAAKDLGRNRVHGYDGEDASAVRRHEEILRVAELREAVDAGRLALVRQPIVALDGGGPDHHELLLRMVGEDGRMVGPGDLIPAAERYGLMGAVDRWVIEQGLRAVASWAEPGGVSINLSGTSLADEGLADFVREAFRRSGADPARVCFEITETAAIGSIDAARRFIESMRALGCSFALDDFGTGVSSFAYLRTLPVDFVKIDGSFVRDLDVAGHEAIVRAIHDAARAFGMRTIAECAESADVVERLREIGIDYAQGYALGRPEALPTGRGAAAS